MSAVEAVIVDAIRTPAGKRNGKLSTWHPADLAAHVLRALQERNGLDPSTVDDVIMGCVGKVGEQTGNIARTAVLTAGWPESVPGTTVDRACSSSQQAIHFAAQGVMSGEYDVVVAAGVESMTRIPMGSAVGKGELGHPYPDSLRTRYAATGLPSQGLGAEMIADEYGLSRHDLDEFGARSQERAALATEAGLFDREILPVPLGDDAWLTADEGIRPGSTVESLGRLKPAFREDGKVTAGNSSQIADGAAGVLIMSAARARLLGLVPRARIAAFSVVGADPVTMLKGPIPATRKVLARAGLSIDDIARVEINEAFASIVLAWQKELGADPDRVNVNGGAIALGHPLGATGAKLMGTLLHELERTGGRYGLEVICAAGGLSNATIIERTGT